MPGKRWTSGPVAVQRPGYTGNSPQVAGSLARCLLREGAQARAAALSAVTADLAAARIPPSRTVGYALRELVGPVV
ncbi:MAG: hypothetical protein JO132_04505 [Streptosporangiaceae bacterium]|nr:hypothetical protein [Streptosporangiaceae bacterium]